MNAGVPFRLSPVRFDRIITREGLVQGRDGVHADAPFALYRLAD